MAIDFISITLDGSEAPLLLKSAIESLRVARRDLEKVRGWMIHSNDGAVWTGLETRFGLPADSGDTVFSLVDGTFQVLNGTTSGYASELIDRVA